VVSTKKDVCAVLT